MTGYRYWTILLIAFSLISLAAVCPAAGQDDPILYIVNPISPKMILPDTFPIPGTAASEISITATPGEYEPASFVVRPNRDIKNLEVETADLAGDGTVIPAADIDIKLVKCWYQATTAWSGIHTRPKEARRILVPELLLNDDTLVQVDAQEKTNQIKLHFPSGDKYVEISDPNEPDGGKMRVLSIEQYPIRDSDSLRDVNISANTNKQFWITVRVPDNTSAGTYHGPIRLRADNETIASVALNVKVLPYRLESPRTHHDLTKPFVNSIYYRGTLHRDYPEGSISSEYKSLQQLEVELHNMFVHGITNPTCYQGFDPELLAQDLKLRNEVGMTGLPLYYLGVSANSNPETIRKLKDFVHDYGIEEVYFYGVDEAQGDRLKAQRVAWTATRQAGGKVFVAGGIGRNFEAMGDIQDLHICAGSPQKEEADKWHSVGHLVFCYANPQGGPEDPQLWRTNFGLLLWLTDYDGACTYCYQHSFGNIWNDFDHYHYRDHNLTYPTVNGVISTIALEGYREAVDDIRYATTLMLEVQKAKESGSPEKRKVADSAEQWLNNLDARTADSSESRAKIIDYTLKLMGI